MAYALVQSPAVAIGAGSSLSRSFSATPTVGNLIIVCVVSGNTGGLGTGALADNQGNTYTRRSLGTLYADVGIYSAIASTASGTFTVTATPTGSGDITLVIAEFSGNTATPFDQTNNAALDASTTPSSGNVTPTEDNELLIGAMTHFGSNRTLTEEAGWTVLQENEGGSTNMPISGIYKIQTTAATEDADWTIGTGSVAWAACIASFKASAAAAATSLFPPRRPRSYLRM